MRSVVEDNSQGELHCGRALGEYVAHYPCERRSGQGQRPPLPRPTEFTARACTNVVAMGGLLR